MYIYIIYIYIILVGGLEHEFNDFPFSWECHHPNWRSHIFQRVGQPPTRYYLESLSSYLAATVFEHTRVSHIPNMKPQPRTISSRGNPKINHKLGMVTIIVIRSFPICPINTRYLLHTYIYINLLITVSFLISHKLERSHSFSWIFHTTPYK